MLPGSRVVRPQLSCGSEITGLGLAGLFFFGGVCGAVLLWRLGLRVCMPITTGASVHLSTFK